MNFTKQNNPVAVGALVVILIAAMYGVFVQIKHVQAAMAADNAAHKPAPQAAGAPTQSSSDSRTILTSYTRPAYSHDPFQQPTDANTRVAQTHVVHIPRPPVLPSTSPDPLRVRPIPVSIPVKPVSTAPQSVPAKPAHDDQIDINSFRVSAIIKGPNTSAIIERAGQPPVSVTTGAKIGDYRVDKIGDDGVILSDSSGIYTISSASGGGAQGGTQPQETANVAQ